MWFDLLRLGVKVGSNRYALDATELVFLGPVVLELRGLTDLADLLAGCGRYQSRAP